MNYSKNIYLPFITNIHGKAYPIFTRKAVGQLMSLTEIKKWSDTFDVLGNPVRLAIVVILYGSSLLFEGKHSLTFGQIMTVIEVPSKPTLANHLRLLMDSGLIEKQPIKDENQRVYPIYSLSDKGREFLIDFGMKGFIENWISDLKTNQ
jgi:DNA-binding transcriptional ArsR family regulator